MAKRKDGEMTKRKSARTAKAVARAELVDELRERSRSARLCAITVERDEYRGELRLCAAAMDEAAALLSQPSRESAIDEIRAAGRRHEK